MISNSKKITCKIADLIVDISTAGGMYSRCKSYLSDQHKSDIVISEDEYILNKWPELSMESTIYLQSGFIFYKELLVYDGMMLHASAVEMDGKAYLFSGPCGVGKSTHTKLWKNVFGEKAQIFNDDKPALRFVDNKWYAYGTPWCGKDGINQNKKVELAGICFLKQGDENSMRLIGANEAITKVIHQTMRRFKDASQLDLMLNLVDQLVREIPIYELTNRPEPEAARLSYETMRRGAEEAGL